MHEYRCFLIFAVSMNHTKHIAVSTNHAYSRGKFTCIIAVWFAFFVFSLSFVHVVVIHLIWIFSQAIDYLEFVWTAFDVNNKWLAIPATHNYKVCWMLLFAVCLDLFCFSWPFPIVACFFFSILDEHIIRCFLIRLMFILWVLLALCIVVHMLFLTISPAFQTLRRVNISVAKQSILQSCVYVSGLVCVCM